MGRALVPYSIKAVTQFSTPSESIVYPRGDYTDSRCIFPSPGLLFREDGGTASNTVSDVQRKEQENEEEGLLCRKCGHVITSPDQQVEVSGGYHHTFFNPAGVVYEIVCFSTAPGCLQYGPSSSEFTWFAGFTWRLSLCALCTAHLGWFFSRDTTFYGLIVKNLIIPHG